MTRWREREEYDRETMARPRMGRRGIFVAILFELAFVAVVVLWAVQRHTEPMPAIEVTEPARAYYGPMRDTSAISRICCRVGR